MIYYIDVSSDDPVTAHVAVENVLMRIGPVVRTAIRIAQTIGDTIVPIRTAGFRYAVAVQPDTNFVTVAQNLIRESGLDELIIGFRPDETYNVMTAEQIETVAAQQAQMRSLLQ